MIQTLQPQSPKQDKPRTKRAVTGGVQSVTSTAPSATPPRPRRTMSQDTQQQPLPTSSGRTKKKASTHADVIDMLDYSGVGAAMFHHDGPFDACAPSRNRQRHRAPIGAFEGDEVPTEAVLPALPPAAAPVSPMRPKHGRARSSTSPAIAINPTYAPPSPQPKKNAIAEAWGMAEPEPFEEFSAGGATSIYAGKSSSNANSNSVGRIAYGDYWADSSTARNTSRNARRARAMPPPQQIALPGSSIDESSYQSSTTPGTPDVYSQDVDYQGGTSPTRPRMGGPKRSRSLMQRIRIMRDNPNVPVGAPDPSAPEPVSPYKYIYGTTPQAEEPLPILYGQDGGVSKSFDEDQVQHDRSGGGAKKSTFFNRLGGRPRHRSTSVSPPVSPTDEGFIVVQSPREKALPSIPRELATSMAAGGMTGYEKQAGGYFDSKPPVSGGGVTPGTPGFGSPLGRRRSLLSKMKGVAKGGK